MGVDPLLGPSGYLTKSILYRGRTPVHLGPACSLPVARNNFCPPRGLYYFDPILVVGVRVWVAGTRKEVRVDDWVVPSGLKLSDWLSDGHLLGRYYQQSFIPISHTQSRLSLTQPHRGFEREM